MSTRRFALKRTEREERTSEAKAGFKAGLGNIKMKPKLIGLFLIVGLIPLITVAVFSMMRAQSALMEQAYNNLQAVQKTKKYQVETYFDERQGDMGVLVETVSTLRDETFGKLEALDDIAQATGATVLGAQLGRPLPGGSAVNRLLRRLPRGGAAQFHHRSERLPGHGPTPAELPRRF